MSYVLGVDLGTTYSAAAIGEDGRVEIVQLGTRQATIPSVVVLRDDGEVLVGEAAERRALSEPGRVAREFKRRLGDPTPLILGGTPYGAEALMARLLEAILRIVATQKGEPPALVAITHPASYGPYKLDLLQQAARQADVHPVTFMSEPVAAAVHYSAQERIEPGAVVAVYDFGGGTFDAALLRRTDAGFELLGEGEGLERLGGIDFDEAVYAHVGNAIDGGLVSAGTGAAAAIGRLREECTRAKETLSEDTEATIPVLLPGMQTDVRLTRAEFETIIRPRIRETIAALERAVRRAGLAMDDVDRILLVGGSSRIPLVAEMVREATGRPVALDAQPKHAIALGAATMALQSMVSAPPPAQDMRADHEAPAAGVAAPGPAATGAAEPEAPATAPPAPAVATSSAAVPAEPTPPAPQTRPRPTDATPPTVAAPAVRPAPTPPAASESRPEAVAAAAQPAAPRGTEPPGNGRQEARAAAEAGGPGNGNGRWRMALYVLGPLVVVVGAIGAFVLLAGGGDDEGDAAGPDATATAAATATDDDGAIATRTRTPTSTPTTAPTATPTRPPQDSEINNITLSGQTYVVDFSTFGFEPLIEGGQFHVHFFFDTVPPEEAGLPADGPWFVYDVPNPFTGYGVADRPTGAEQMCILVARADHSVIQGTGNCFDLP